MKNLLVLQDYPKLLDALNADSSAVGCSVDFGLATLFILSNDGKLSNYMLGKCLIAQCSIYFITRLSIFLIRRWEFKRRSQSRCKV